MQIVIGAEVEALLAFGLARVPGRDVLRRVFGDRVDAGLIGSQAALTAKVFASRLRPFVSVDMIIHWDVFCHLREEISAKGWVSLMAIALGAVVLAAIAAMKWQSDPLIVVAGIGGMAMVFLFVRVFLARTLVREDARDHR